MTAPTPSVLVAEAVTFSPGEVVLILAALGLVLAVVGGIVVVGIVSGYRTGRYPDRVLARRAWIFCLVVEGLWLIAAVVRPEPTPIVFGLCAAGAAVAAREVGRRSPPPVPE